MTESGASKVVPNGTTYILLKIQSKICTIWICWKFVVHLLDENIDIGNPDSTPWKKVILQVTWNPLKCSPHTILFSTLLIHPIRMHLHAYLFVVDLCFLQPRMHIDSQHNFLTSHSSNRPGCMRQNRDGFQLSKSSCFLL